MSLGVAMLISYIPFVWGIYMEYKDEQKRAKAH